MLRKHSVAGQNLTAPAARASTRDLLNTLDTAGFRSLGDVWADTTTPHDFPTLDHAAIKYD
jgi:hypothetical protein